MSSHVFAYSMEAHRSPFMSDVDLMNFLVMVKEALNAKVPLRERLRKRDERRQTEKNGYIVNSLTLCRKQTTILTITTLFFL